MELEPEFASARVFCEALLKRGVLSKDTHQTVVRFAPPLTVTRETLDRALAAIEQTFADLDEVTARAEACTA
jgi:ornithine--oxo-acid transaminase